MSEHDPAMRTQDRDVVCDGFRIGWTDADVDQRNAGTVSTLQ